MPSISARRFVATMNNPVRNDIPFDWFESEDVVYVAWQREIGGVTGTPHLQIYFIVKENERNKNGHTIKWVTENLSNKMHVAIARGTHEECVNYVTKEDSRDEGPWILGEWDGTSNGGGAAKGRASQKKEAESVKSKIEAGVDNATLWKEHFNYMVVHSKAMDTFRLTLAANERNWVTKCLVLTGPPGTGKSRRAMQLATQWGGGFWLRKPKFGGSVWFDGYDPLRMPVLVLDEFDGSWMSFEELCRILDRNPLHLEGKGTMLPCLFRYCIITSNKLPREWYSEEAVGEIRYKALLRRMTGKLGALRHMTTVVNDDEDDNNNVDFTDLVDEAVREIERISAPAFRAPLKSSYEETDEYDYRQSDDNDDEWDEEEEVDDLGIDDQIDDIEYQQERYDEPTQPLRPLLSGGVIDISADDDLEPSRIEPCCCYIKQAFGVNCNNHFMKFIH